MADDTDGTGGTGDTEDTDGTEDIDGTGSTDGTGDTEGTEDTDGTGDTGGAHGEGVGNGDGHDHGDLTPRTAAVEEVLALREAVLADHPTERVSLDAAPGRVLAEDVVAEADAPARSRATMDGFAFRAGDGYPLDLRDGETFPEDDPASIAAGEAVRVATGAPIPERADVVLKREDATVADGELSGPALEPGTYVSERGQNYEAGERLFAAGERLSAKDAVLLRELDRETPAVRAPFSVGLLATGTEIHEGVTPDLDGPMLAGLVSAWGHDATAVGTAPDEYDAVRERVREAAETHDVVVTTGGTSVGHADHVVRVLRDLGAVLFHRVALRPGKPIAVARLPAQDAVAFAVPGKPVGAYVVSALVMGPFFTGDPALATRPATLAADVRMGPPGFEYAVPVTVQGIEGATPRAVPLGHADSPLAVYADTFDPSVLSAATRATRMDGFVLATDDLAEGDRVDVVPARWLEA